LQAELHSIPLSLGSFNTDTNGNLNAQVTIPTGIPAGYHTLHFYGTDITGQAIDIYKVIYIASTADDLDGNGILDSIQKCVGIEPANQDYDQDGVDDSCDGEISQPPATSSPVNISANISSGPNNLLASSNTSLSSPQDQQATNTKHVSRATPTVLSAVTLSDKRNAIKNDELKIPNRFFVIIAAIFLQLTTLGYLIKLRLAK
jgi:hypothetical protein